MALEMTAIDGVAKLESIERRILGFSLFVVFALILEVK